MEDQRQLLIWLLRQGKECEWLEFKQNFHSPDEIGETISALANGACLHQQASGYLVFGISDELEVVGTTFDLVQQKKGNEQLENWIVQRLSPRIDFRILVTEITGRRVVIIEVPAARNQPVNFTHQAFVRVGSINRKLREFPDKERKIWNNRPDIIFVNETALADLHAQDLIDMLDTQSFFEMLDIPYPSNREEVIKRLIDENLAKQSKGGYIITNLGAILFAKKLSGFPTVARKAARVVVYHGKDKLSPIRDYTGRYGYASGFTGMVQYIYDQLPANEAIGNVIRTSVNMFPQDAIREIVANALIHQDFSEFGSGPTVEIYSDRIEVTNPGIPLIAPSRFIDGYKSRNESLATLMRRLGICEERGSGVDRVIFNCEMNQLPAPDFRVLETQTQVILYAHRKLSEMDRQDKIRACYQHCCLRYISNDHMTNQSLRQRFNIDDQNAAIASRIISETYEEGLIKLHDPENKSRKYTRYVPVWA